MAGKFDIRWEIDNVAATLAAKKAESKVFSEGGFQWIVGVQSNKLNGSIADFTLTCANQRGVKWRCEADVQVEVPNEIFDSCVKDRVQFNNGKPTHVLESVITWEHLIDPFYGYLNNGNAVIVVHVNIRSSEHNIEASSMFDFSKLLSPNRSSNVTLVIGEKKLQVSKDFLALHSPIFTAILFDNSVEKENDEVAIEDVIYEEFLDLIQVIYPDAVEIDDRTVLHILKLAHRFQMTGVVNRAEKFLINLSKIKNKLIIADHYKLIRLRDHCLQSFITSQEMIQKLKPESFNFSAETKAAIYERIFKM